uniref:Major facilitator superfamily protein, expressed n=1 Tax=Oryza sativa subsp. japonica TaxID=39947 RepID=Q8H887_ORYSJ|nr:Putative sugar transporter protein [Oryza sativa Japonica Group]ABF93784.1 major facilitator superfamily protein, expressed [Oryza sativa Japonica Group]
MGYAAADLGAWKNTRQQYSPSSPISLGSSVFSESSLELSTTTADGSTANAVLAAIVASIGNLLQGWDNAAIAGAIMYIKNEFNLQNDPMMEGLILAMSLIGATIITALSGMITNSIGKRPLLSVAAILYSISALIMFQASNEYMLLLARLIYGFGSGLVVTYAPLYISETAPTNMRGLLNTLPQFNGSLGMLLSYIMVFLMSLTLNPNWRIMLGSLSIPSFVFLLLCIFYLPESPVFLVSKGKIEEAKNVMKRLRGTNEVSSEIAFLIQGLTVDQDNYIEDYMIGHNNDEFDDQSISNTETTKLYGHEEGVTWFARPFKGKNVVESDHSPIPNLLDPIVTLFDSIHGNILNTPEFTSSGNMSNDIEQPKTDLESQEDLDTDYEDDLGHPLLFHQGSYMEGIDDACVNGGWHIAWKFVQRENEFGQTQDDFQQIFLQGDILQAGRVSHATALVSTPSFHHSIGPAMVHPSKFNLSTEGQSWSDLLQPGVKQGLIVGVTIQILQQLAGISGILYYTPQILEQAGAGILLKWFNVSSSSSSILTSALTTFTMLPSIGIAMKCMDRYGRRSLLLYTIPMLIVSLIILIVVNVMNLEAIFGAILSTFGVIIYVCCFVMGFGPIPNVLCSELFPPSCRNRCMSICTLTFWIVSIIVTYAFPVMLSSIGLIGVCGIYAVVCIVSFIFVLIKVPETKGMPLAVIANSLAVGARLSVKRNENI